MFVDNKPLGEPVKIDEGWREVIHAAIQVLERDGWCQGMNEAPDGRRCAVGALYVGANPREYLEGSTEFSRGNSNDRYEARLRIERAIGNGTVLFCWNDAPGRTAEEVIAKLREVVA